jgi:4-alpha-glucanotransferase
VYTGTHDNDTTAGWFESAPEEEQAFAQRYLGREDNPTVWDFIRTALMSVADTVVVPLQDVLEVGSAARMNFPGKPSGNWGWRYTPEMLSDADRNRLKEMVELYGRGPIVARDEESKTKDEGSRTGDEGPLHGTEDGG